MQIIFGLIILFIIIYIITRICERNLSVSHKTENKNFWKILGSITTVSFIIILLSFFAVGILSAIAGKIDLGIAIVSLAFACGIFIDSNQNEVSRKKKYYYAQQLFQIRELRDANFISEKEYNKQRDKLKKTFNENKEKILK